MVNGAFPWTILKKTLTINFQLELDPDYLLAMLLILYAFPEEQL